MLIIRFLRFVKGYVSFTASGGFIERFVNLCSKNRIPLWNLKRYGDFLEADTSVKGYKIIRESAKRSGVRVSMRKKHGLPFFIRSNRKRSGILIGMSFAAVLVAFLSSMLWNISVTGNSLLTDEQILEAFYSQGVKIGAFRNDIDCSQAAYQVTRQLPELYFASVNIIGSRAEIVVSERTVKPEFPNESNPCNIVASENGTVLSVEANIGKAEIKAGDAVIKGDLLISGITENADGSENIKAARGRVFAEVEKNINTENTDFTFSTQKSEKNRQLIYILGLKIPLGFPVDEINKTSVMKSLTNGEIILPAGIISEHSFALSEELELPDDYRALFRAYKFIGDYKEIYFQSEEIISQAVSKNKKDDSVFYSGEYKIKKDIGVSKAILVDIS